MNNILTQLAVLFILILLIPMPAHAHSFIAPVLVTTGCTYLGAMLLTFLIAKQGTKLRWSFCYLLAACISFGCFFWVFSQTGFIFVLLLPLVLLIIAVFIKFYSKRESKT